MIITVESPELAAHLHNYGRGWKARDQYNNIYWVNPDLIKTDRIAGYKARKLAKERRSNLAANGGRNNSPAVSLSGSAASSHTNSPAVHANRVPIVHRRLSLSSVSSVESRVSRRSASRPDLR